MISDMLPPSAENGIKQDPKRSTEEKTGRISRSGRSLIDWSKCFICKHKTYKKLTEMISVSTFEACESIKKAAAVKGDEEMLHVLRGVNDDLIAFFLAITGRFISQNTKAIYSPGLLISF